MASVLRLQTTAVEIAAETKYSYGSFFVCYPAKNSRRSLVFCHR